MPRLFENAWRCFGSNESTPQSARLVAWMSKEARTFGCPKRLRHGCPAGNLLRNKAIRSRLFVAPHPNRPTDGMAMCVELGR